MCEYCGCQALDAVRLLTREHDAVVDLIGRVRQAASSGDVAAAAHVARDIRAVLEPHTHVEEEGLFPAMAGEFPQHVEALRAEDAVIDGVLAEAAHGTPGDPSWAARLTEAMHVLRDHILKEQDGVFPAALAVLGPDDWDAIEQARALVGTVLPPVPTEATA